MSRSYIAKALRDQIATDARHRCGYCLTSARIIGAPMEIDHIIPESLGGPTLRENLWLACSMCNDHKGNRIAVRLNRVDLVEARRGWVSAGWHPPKD